MLISHGHQPPLASQSRADDMLEGPESLSENEVAAVFDEIEQRIAKSPGSAIDPKLGGHEILAGRIYDFAELEQVDKGIVSGAFEDDVQQVGSVSEDGVSNWDVFFLLTLEGRESFAKFCQGWQLPFAGNWSKLKAPSSFAPYTTQSPRPSRCHLSTSCCSGGQTVESPSRRRRRPLARNTRTIYRAKCFKCGWDCLVLNKSAPYASIYPLLYTLIAPPSSQPRSKRELDFKFVSGRSMERLEVEFEAYAQSHSYDSPLVSQPSMSSSSSSSQLRLTLGLLTPSLDFSRRRACHTPLEGCLL
ncbi:hypothetical protein M405DRAFT_935305 [Rhizopogon salebrosus TDB-379]|nr:hypothetical protein M405DRAFT_935305 [Rhizopogon salebrosus TDB-379]